MKKKLLVALVVVGLCSTVALAFDPMGPPAAGLGKGKTSLGIEYIWNKMEFERNTRSWSGSDRTPKFDPMQKVYGVFGYGLADNVDVFARAGAAWADYELSASSGNWDFDGSTSFVWGLGMKATLAEEPGVKWGFLAQYSFARLRGEQTRDGDDENWQMQLDELQIAFGPTWTPSQGLCIYGGPFLHWIRGTEERDQWGDTYRYSVEEENWVGGYIGAQLDVAQNCVFNMEWLQTADDMAVAAGLIFRQSRRL